MGVKFRRLQDSLQQLAKPHGIFLLWNNGTLDFLDETTGRSLGQWYQHPKPHFFVRGVYHNGLAEKALAAIVHPHELVPP